MKLRLDQELTRQGVVDTRSQAESWVKLGKVTVDGKVITKPEFYVRAGADIKLTAPERYVSRAGLKLAGVASKLGADFKGKVVLDVGSSTGGFTDYALKHGASLVYAVDVGTNQLHASLRSDRRIKLHEKTDIRDFVPEKTPDIIVIDVSFISLRQILPHIASIAGANSRVYAMVKPQFEATRQQLTSGGIVKNNSVRRAILKDFENWSKGYFRIEAKADSDVKGANGNIERFYCLAPLSTKH